MESMSLTIAYFTSRQDPKLEWFFASLKRETRGSLNGLQIIIVDYHACERSPGWLQDKISYSGVSPLGCIIDHIAPKPCVWQGKHKLTKNDYFAASNARNTAFAKCQYDFIACVDDLSALSPGWMDQVKHAQLHKYVALGSYKKVLDLSVSQEGEITHTPFPPGVDSRWNSGGNGIVNAGGGWMFGCSFALPIEAALKVNGFDEICDGQGAEDYDFGIRLERSGERLYYNRNMLTYESEELHHSEGNHPFKRISKMMQYDGGIIGSDHVLFRMVTRQPRITTLADHYNLRELREKILSGGEFPIPSNPQHDWRDKTPLSEM
jgi:hypothetical protein